MSQTIRTKAIVLRRTNYGEADRILTILTPDNGKLSLMARGVRKEKSRLAGGIELFAICDLVSTHGANNTGDLWTLTGSRMNKFFAQIMTDYDRLQFGYEVIKLVSNASENIDEPEFYELLEQSLTAINNLKINLKITQTWFYLRLASLLGNDLNTATDNHGMKLVEDARYDFDQRDQVFMFNENGRYYSSTLKILRVLTSNQPEIAARIAEIETWIDDCLCLARIAAKI